MVGEILGVSLLLPAVSLLALVCLPSRIANAHPDRLRRFVTAVLCFQLAIALGAAIGRWFTGDVVQSTTLGGFFDIGVLFDGAASLMFLLVSFVSLVVCRFSERYVDADAREGRYFRWMGVTVGAVSTMVIAGNLLFFYLAWVATSLALHQLLTHYPERPGARRAAWTKFVISRLGDLFLIAAIALTFSTFQTFDLASVFAQAKSAQGDAAQSLSIIGWLLVLGAVTKSAQFPFHTWLPDTMETPTPVSALMHAGIVNAGGYLMIRMSPIVAQAPAALATLAAIGAVTACFGAVVMMTQPSVKRGLAYSTIAQMGFMMLQCGLGAFSAALLHILAHSLYKAYAFLSTGSVVQQAQATRGVNTAPQTDIHLGLLLAAGVGSVATFLAISFTLGINVAEKPGGLVLAMILCMALTSWGWRMLSKSFRTNALTALLGIAALNTVYLGAYIGVDRLISPALPAMQTTSAAVIAMVGIAVAFAGLFILQTMVRQGRSPKWLDALRVHAANGFYIDTLYQRIFGAVSNV